MTEITDLLERNLSSVFNERNRLKRLSALQDVWAPNGVLAWEDGTHVGQSNIELAVSSLLRRYPEFDFTAIGITDEVAGAGRLRWAFGSSKERPAVTGEDVAFVANGHIVALYRFLDGPAL